MNKPSRIGKRLLVPVVLGAALLGAQSVLATAPTASFNFTVSPTAPAVGCKTVSFTDTSGDLENDIQSLQWNFGDGTTQAGALTGTVTHTYANADDRTVTLTATDADADTDGDPLTPGDGIEVGTASTLVDLTNTVPTAGVTNPVNPRLGTPITVQGAGTDPDGRIASFAWDLDGDGAFDDATTQNATPSYTEPGDKTVELQVTDNCGATDTQQAFFHVTNPIPVASFSVLPTAPSANQAITFTSTSTDQPGGSIASYQWDLDDDDVYNEPGTDEANTAAVTTTFTTGGFKTIKLIVTDNNGDSDDFVRSVNVSALPLPDAGLRYTPAHPLPGQAVTLTSTSSASTAANAPALNASATQWDFNFTGAFTLDGVGPSASTSFATPGPKTVAVKATDAAGGTDVEAATIVVNAPPQASFTTNPRKLVAGTEATFSSTSSDPDGPLAKQEWDLNGDGKYERTGAVVSTSSLKAGTRTVRLRVTDQWGAVVTTSKSINVVAPNLDPPQDLRTDISYTRKSWGIVVVGFTVKTPAKTSVAVSCKGKGCPRGTFRKKTGKKSATLKFSQLNGSLRAGAKINVIFTKRGRFTGWDLITVHRGQTSLRQGCKLSSKQKKWKRCPS
jgi:PKD repeat protein